jgi:hypothetical protein
MTPMMRRLALLSGLVLASAGCGDDGSPDPGGDLDFECQANCMDAEGQTTQGFDSYTINSVSSEEAAEAECYSMAQDDVVGACGEGRSLRGGCVCAPRSPN